MDVILIPGLWLDARSWDGVVPALRAAGHRPHPLTMPGTGEPAASSAAVGIEDWVRAVTDRIDALDGRIAIVGHSGGGNVAWAAADRRVDRVERVVLVDTAVPFDGGIISPFDVVDGVVPFPGWDGFDAPDVADLARARADAAAMTASVPARVPTDPVRLHDGRRRGVAVTVLSGAFDEAGLREQLAQWPPYADEFAQIEQTDVVRLGTGHWPQFSAPDVLAAALVDALG